MTLGAGKDAPKRTRKPASAAEEASRLQMHARTAAGKKKQAAEAAAARARLQASLLGGSSQRASGAGSSSQDIAAASESTEGAAAGDLVRDLQRTQVMMFSRLPYHNTPTFFSARFPSSVASWRDTLVNGRPAAD